MPRSATLFKCPQCDKGFDSQSNLNRHIGMTKHKASNSIAALPTPAKQKASNTPDAEQNNLYAVMREVLAANKGPMRGRDLAQAIISANKSPSESLQYLQVMMTKAAFNVRGDIDYNGHGQYNLGTGKVKGRRALRGSNVVATSIPTAAASIVKKAKKSAVTVPTITEQAEPTFDQMNGQAVAQLFLTRENERIKRVAMQLAQVVVSTIGLD